MNGPQKESPPIVDASVAIKWFVPEIHAAFARRLLQDDQIADNQTLLVPDLFFCEVGNILWKHIWREEMSLEKAQAILQSITDLPFEVHRTLPLMPSALSIAAQTRRSVYDSLYLALAVREQTTLITADSKLFHALHGQPLGAYLLWVEDIEESL